MKRIITLLLTLILCLSVSACRNPGTTDNAEIDYGSSTFYSDAEIDYGSSTFYSEAEIKSAVEAVLTKFRDFNGCDLIRLWYDEEKSDNFIQRDIASGGMNTIKSSGAEPENIIILFSDFYVDASGGDGSFSPDSIYTGWNWILIRDSENDKWKIADWGY